MLQKGNALVLSNELDGPLVGLVVLGLLELTITKEDLGLPFDLLTVLALEEIDRHGVNVLVLLLRHDIRR